jgi:hypothetical protein
MSGCSVTSRERRCVLSGNCRRSDVYALKSLFRDGTTYALRLPSSLRMTLRVSTVDRCAEFADLRITE